MTVQQLQEAHRKALERNNWKESVMSRLFARNFDALPLVQVGKCMECGGRAKITCQYH